MNPLLKKSIVLAFLALSIEANAQSYTYAVPAQGQAPLQKIGEFNLSSTPSGYYNSSMYLTNALTAENVAEGDTLIKAFSVFNAVSPQLTNISAFASTSGVSSVAAKVSCTPPNTLTSAVQNELCDVILTLDKADALDEDITVRVRGYADSTSYLESTYIVKVLSGSNTPPSSSNIVIDPSPSYSFEDTQVANKALKVISITNSSASDALENLTLSYDTSIFKVELTNCAYVLGPNETCYAQVSFNPENGVTYSGTFTATADYPAGQSTSVLFTGNGIAQVLPPSLSISPDTYFEFPAQGLGSTTSPQIFTITNTGTTESLTGLSVSFDSSEFQLNNTCGSELAAKQSCSVTISPTYDAIGNAFGTLVASADNSENGIQSVSVGATTVTDSSGSNVGYVTAEMIQNFALTGQSPASQTYYGTPAIVKLTNEGTTEVKFLSQYDDTDSSINYYTDSEGSGIKMAVPQPACLDTVVGHTTLVPIAPGAFCYMAIRPFYAAKAPSFIPLGGTTLPIGPESISVVLPYLAGSTSTSVFTTLNGEIEALEAANSGIILDPSQSTSLTAVKGPTYGSTSRYSFNLTLKNNSSYPTMLLNSIEQSSALGVNNNVGTSIYVDDSNCRTNLQPEATCSVTVSVYYQAVFNTSTTDSISFSLPSRKFVGDYGRMKHSIAPVNISVTLPTN